MNKYGFTLLLPYVEQQAALQTLNQNGAYGGYQTGLAADYPVAMGDPATNGNAAVMSPANSAVPLPQRRRPAYVKTSGSYGISMTTTLECPRINYGFSTLPYYDYYWSNGLLGQLHATVHYKTYRAMFGNISNCKSADIRDGTSNTAAMSKRRGWWNGNGLSWGYTRPCDVRRFALRSAEQVPAFLLPAVPQPGQLLDLLHRSADLYPAGRPAGLVGHDGLVCTRTAARR